MTKRYAPLVPDPSYHRPKDAAYFHELLNTAELSQRKAGPALGLSERSVRNRVADDSWSYPEQFMLEVLADTKLRQQGQLEVREPALAYDARRTVWYQSTQRPLQRTDVGMMIVAKDLFGMRIVGDVAADGFGLVIRCSEGLDVRKVPIDRIAVYTLLDPPPST